MSALSKLYESLQETRDLIGRLEQSMIDHPEIRSMALNLKSLRRLRKQLEDKFDVEVAQSEAEDGRRGGGTFYPTLAAEVRVLVLGGGGLCPAAAGRDATDLEWPAEGRV